MILCSRSFTIWKLLFICLVGFPLANASTCENTPEHGRCDTSWASFYGHCYFVNVLSLNYTLARTHCARQSAYLADIQSPCEDEFVQNLLIHMNRDHPNNREDVWIGYNDLKEEGKWVSDHTNNPLKYKNWNVSQPNNRTPMEDCAEIFNKGNHGTVGKWNDVDCSAGRWFLCKKELTLSSGLATTMTPTSEIGQETRAQDHSSIKTTTTAFIGSDKTTPANSSTGSNSHRPASLPTTRSEDHLGLTKALMSTSEIGHATSTQGLSSRKTTTAASPRSYKTTPANISTESNSHRPARQTTTKSEDITTSTVASTTVIATVSIISVLLIAAVVIIMVCIKRKRFARNNLTMTLPKEVTREESPRYPFDIAMTENAVYGTIVENFPLENLQLDSNEMTENVAYGTVSAPLKTHREI